MANDWTKNPIEIDTAEDKAGKLSVKRLEWHPAAADDDLLIKDSLGNTIWKTRASVGAPNGEDYGVLECDIDREYINGLYITTIDGGTLYVHLK